MLFLILAALSSTLIAVIMRLAETKITSRMGMFAANYALCALLSAAFSGFSGVKAAGEGADTALLLGGISGVLYLACFMLYRLCILKNGVAVSSTFMKLGVIIPTCTAIWIFGEQVLPARAAGLVLAAAAILVFQYEKGGLHGYGLKSALLLPALLFLSGITDGMANLYSRLGTAGAKDLYLLFTFVMALVLSVLLCLAEKKKPRASDLLWGALIGLPNYFSSRFLLLSLSSLPATLVYPTYSVGTVLLSCAAGMLLFKEKLTPRKWIAMAIIAAALVLLSM